MGIYNAVSKANDLVSGAVGIASSKKEFIAKQSINFVLLFVVLLVFGCLDFAKLEFHLEYITTPSYWGTVTTKAVAGVCSFNIGINIIMDTEIKKNKVLQDLIAQYNELKEKKQLDFEYYVNRVFNRQEKKKAYIAHINRRIYLLNRFSRRKDRLLYSSDLPENAVRKAKNRYCRARKDLEELKSDEFIEKNLDSLYVRYYEVDPAIFELEIDGTPSIRGVKTKGSIMRGRIKASSSVVLGMVVFSMFVTAFALQADKQMFEDQMEAFWHYFLKALEDTFVVLWQFSQGMMKVRKIVSQQLTEPYAGRCAVLTAYLDWRLNEGLADTKIYQEMKKEKAEETEEEVIEVTQEEFEKMKNRV